MPRLLGEDGQHKNMHCNTENFNLGRLYVIRSSINESPEYQRESAVWSPEKRELFIDSLINGYDIPKIYFHDLCPLKESDRECGSYWAA